MRSWTLFDKELLEREIEDVLDEAHSMLPLRRPVQVEWRNYPATAGRALLEDSRICLSHILLTTAERVRDTVLHEYAHLFVFERWGYGAKPHGPEWRDAVQLLGLEPEVTHAYSGRKARRKRRLICRCEKCSAIIRRSRPLMRRREYTHVGCGGRVVEDRRKR